MIILKPQQILDLFFHRQDVFALQQSNGAYFPVKSNITIEEIEKHLEGKITLGSYCLKQDNTVKWACVDLDGTDLPLLLSHATLIYDEFKGFNRILEFSGRRGYHVWIIFNEPQQALYAQKLVKARLNKLGLISYEVFPKQTELNATRLYGNLVKIPLATHKMSGKKSIILKMEMNQ